MSTPVVSAKRTTPAKEVAQRLLSGHYTGLPVTEYTGEIVGVISEFDLLEAARKGHDLSKATAEEVMTHEPITADLDTPASEMIRLMEEFDIARLPITYKGNLIGVVARCDILQSLMIDLQLSEL